MYARCMNQFLCTATLMIWMGAIAKAGEPDTCSACNCDKKAKTLFEWAIGCKCEEPEEEGEGEEFTTITTDRPDFTESSSTVGLGRIQLEAGYTFTDDEDGVARVRSHSFPEVLLRVGLFAEWLEFRLGWNYAIERTTVRGITNSEEGAEDLLLGVKVALTEQKCHLPETAIIFQSTAPTGSDAFTADEFLPGINYLYGWELSECVGIAGSTQGNRAVDGFGHPYVEFSQSATIAIGLTERLGAYSEWYAFFPHSAIDPDVGVEHYYNGGLTYLISADFQIDWRAGFGLNERADDFFTGVGMAIRY